MRRCFETIKRPTGRILLYSWEMQFSSYLPLCGPSKFSVVRANHADGSSMERQTGRPSPPGRRRVKGTPSPHLDLFAFMGKPKTINPKPNLNHAQSKRLLPRVCACFIAESSPIGGRPPPRIEGDISRFGEQRER